MKLSCSILILISCLAATALQAQTLRGTVVENGTNTRMGDVLIRDLNNKQLVTTDEKGNFIIKAAVGHSLIFSSPGYVSDTLYVVDLVTKQIKMQSQSIALREVTIKSSSNGFNPQAEYPEVYQNSKVYALSPSTWFGKSGKDARRLKHYFTREAQERHIDSAFSRVYVGSLVPLKGQDLDDFMTMYRPTYAFLRSNTGPSLVAYINDSYRKWQALPADKRHLQRLTAQ